MASAAEPLSIRDTEQPHAVMLGSWPATCRRQRPWVQAAEQMLSQMLQQYAATAAGSERRRPTDFLADLERLRVHFPIGVQLERSCRDVHSRARQRRLIQRCELRRRRMTSEQVHRWPCRCALRTHGRGQVARSLVACVLIAIGRRTAAASPHASVAKCADTHMPCPPARWVPGSSS